ncbi:MAG: Spo0E family sporulation regulatory protein-aspartic acid phosphatase [Ruminiclostridium sp.]
MKKEDLEKIREKLNLLINKDSDYIEILKASQELDYFITEFTSRSIYKYE